MLDMEAMTLAELKELAKENNIKNISKLKKDELITVLNQVTKTTDKQPKIEEKEVIERQYDENGEPIIDYK